MTRATVVDKRRKWDALKANAAQLRNLTVTVGVHDDAGAHGDGAESVAQIAAQHEFGAGRVPERSFLRSTFDRNRGKYADLIKTLAQDVAVQGQSPDLAARKLGVIASGDVKATIQAGIDPPLSPETKAARDEKAAHGGGLASMAQTYTPLIDSGQLLASITFRVD